jgi:hypothetical protein
MLGLDADRAKRGQKNMRRALLEQVGIFHKLGEFAGLLPLRLCLSTSQS